ncbi:MAG: hypothetical protein ACOC7U_05390 [Spirochaetota bacterium]
MKTFYSLHGFIIFEDHNLLGWMLHIGDIKDTGEMRYVTGKAYIEKEHNVLLLGRPRFIGVDNERITFDAVEEYLRSLPQWDKTEYYVKLADIKMSSLIKCETGEVVYSDKNEEILKNLQEYDSE